MSSLPSKNAEKVRTGLPLISRWPKWLRWSILAVVVIALGAGTYAVVRARQVAATASQEATLQTAIARQGTLTLQASGTGYLVAASEAEVSFDTNGKLKSLYVKLGDEVQTGQLLAELDDTSQQEALESAERALRELTSADAIANAKLAVTSAEAGVINAQYALNGLQYWQNDALIESYYANYVVAKDKLDKAQEFYDKVSAGKSINDPDVAQAYQSVYSALTAYNTAKYYYSLYSQKPTQRQLDEAQANLDLAQARLTEAKTYMTTFTGGEVPEDATGTELEQLRQAQLAVQTAQDNLDATKLYAPIAGTVMTLNAKVGQAVSATVMTIDDLSQATIQFCMDESDWNNVKVDYEVSVSFDALSGQTFSGAVTEVMPGLVSVQGSSMVEGTARLDKSVAEIGLPVGVEAGIDVISGQAKNVVLVPVEALHEIGDGKYTVFVMENGTPTVRSVEVGLQDDTFAEIKSGLTAGEVVTTGVVETQQ